MVRAGPLAEDQDFAGVVGDTDVHPAEVGGVAPGGADFLRADLLRPASLVRAGQVEERHDGALAHFVRNVGGQALVGQDDMLVDVLVVGAGLVGVDAGHEPGEDEDAVAGVTVLAVDVALVVDRLPGPAVGLDLLVAFLLRPGRAVHRHRPVHRPLDLGVLSLALGDVVEAVTDSLRHAVATPAGALQTAGEGLDPAGDGIVLRA